MPAPSPNSQLDGISIITKGMNSGVVPRLIPMQQVAMAVNVTFRNGLPRTRPVWRRVPLTFNDNAIKANATTGLFQKAHGYQAYGSGEDCLVASIGGHLFRYLVGSSNVVQDVSISSATTLTAPFTIPAINSTAVMTVTSTAGLAPGMMLSLEGANYQVVVVTNATTMTVRNMDGVAGTIIAIGPPAPVVTCYTDLNNPLNPDCWMWQSEDFLIVNNGAADPLFFDGAGTRRSLGDAGEELPAGCMGAYVQGRNWMVLPGADQKPSQEFMAGDLVYSHGFMDGYDGRAAVLKTEENTFFSGGGAFSVPVDAGAITAMATVAVADTSLGQGALQVMTAGSVFSVQVPFLREDWATTQYPLMTVGLPGYGALGQEGVVSVNGDLWYRSFDGFRSYQVGRRDMGTWVRTPLSVEVEKILALDSDTLLGGVNGVLFDNRLLMSCSPVTGPRGVEWRGLVALDFNGISTLTSRSEPAYDGLWTGLRVLQVLKAVINSRERCFAFVADRCDRIALYELMKDNVGWFDYDGTNNVMVQSAIETRAMSWSDGGNALKRLQCADIYLDRIAGDDTVGLAFKYRSDEDQTWQTWHSFSLCAPVKDCTVNGCPTFTNVREHYRTYLRLPDPPDVCSPVTKRMTRTGYEFQLRFAWTGFLQWNRVHLWAEAIKDSVVKACPTSETCVLLKGCDEPWFGYEVESAACTDPIESTGVPAIPPPRPGTPGTEPDTEGGGGGTGDLPPPTPVPEPTPIDGPPTWRPLWPPPVPVGEPVPVYGVDPDTGIEIIPETAPCSGLYELPGPTLSKEDPITHEILPVGLPGDPLVEPVITEELLASWSADVVAAWDAYVIAGGVVGTPTHVYIRWTYAVDGGFNFLASSEEPTINSVYGTPSGNWFRSKSLNWKLVVWYC